MRPDRDTLTVGTAQRLCREVQDVRARNRGALTLDLRDVTYADVLGLAALLQSTRAADRHGIPYLVCANPVLYRTLVDARLPDEIALDARSLMGAPAAWDATDSDEPPPVLATSSRIRLRKPALNEVVLFDE